MNKIYDTSFSIDDDTLCINPPCFPPFSIPAFVLLFIVLDYCLPPPLFCDWLISNCIYDSGLPPHFSLLGTALHDYFFYSCLWDHISAFTTPILTSKCGRKEGENRKLSPLWYMKKKSGQDCFQAQMLHFSKIVGGKYYIVEKWIVVICVQKAFVQLGKTWVLNLTKFWQMAKPTTLPSTHHPVLIACLVTPHINDSSWWIFFTAGLWYLMGK